VKVDWTPLAISHLQCTHDYIARDSPAAARKIVGQILGAAERLANYPSMGRAGRIEGTRELVIPGTPFIVAYRIRRSDLQILAVLHTSRKWPERL
jgi:toxin ParE1/3/4